MDKRHNTNGRRFFFGFILILIGLVMILERSGVISWEVYDFLLSWKMLLVAIGALVFFSGNRGAGIIVMGIGTFFMLPDIFNDYIQIKRFFWPTLLLVAGLTFIFSNRGRRRFEEHVHVHGGPSGNGPSGSGTSGNGPNFGPGTSNISQDYFDEFVMFGGREVNLSSSDFKGGRATAIFGGSDIDLRQCQISPQGCTIDVTTLFGANAFKVPNDWTVLNKVTTIFGGYSDLRIKDPNYSPTPSKTIVITGVCLFGATEVKNYSKAR